MEHSVTCFLVHFIAVTISPVIKTRGNANICCRTLLSVYHLGFVQESKITVLWDKVLILGITIHRLVK